MEFADLIKVTRVDNVILKRSFHEPLEGTLCITGHHLILSSRIEDAQELFLLHKNVDVVERKPANYGGAMGGGTVILKCKDFAILHFEISSGINNFNDVSDSIEALCNIEAPVLHYPFFYSSIHSIVEDGWTAFTVESEFSKLLMSTDDWRISHVNRNFQVCSSYPESVVVPKNVSDEVIAIAASFRHGGRFPVLCYHHKETNSELLRSGQPLVGPSNKRCKEDERLINSVLGPGKRGYIVDTRTQTLAQAAKSRGGGFELEMHYPQWRRIHKPIERHSNLMESLAKLVDACNDTSCSMDKWLSRLESSNWLLNVCDTLNCACLIAQCLECERSSVLVHGSDGTDTTLAVTSLTQIILNPDCRSIRGFEALIEREWIQAGYPFSSRHFHSAYAASASSIKNPKKKYAPTFILFMDSVFQLLTQWPCSFEFTESFLITIIQHSYASQFGTFLCDCVAERVQIGLMEKTTSLWSYINRPDIIQAFINPVYDPNSKIIWPSVAPASLSLWSGLFLQWVVDQSSTIKSWSAISEMKDKEKELKRQALKLRKQLIELEKQLQAKNAADAARNEAEAISAISTSSSTTTSSAPIDSNNDIQASTTEEPPTPSAEESSASGQQNNASSLN